MSLIQPQYQQQYQQQYPPQQYQQQQYQPQYPPQQYQATHDQQTHVGGLPFQQINPHSEVKQSSEALLAQRIGERRALEMPRPGQAPPVHMTPNNPYAQNPLYIVPPGMESSMNAHPAQIAQFQSMDMVAHQRMRAANPKLFFQILSTMQRQYMHAMKQYQLQMEQQQQQMKPAEGDTDISDTETEVSSDISNQHSSDEEQQQRVKRPKKPSRRTVDKAAASNMEQRSDSPPSSKTSKSSSSKSTSKSKPGSSTSKSKSESKEERSRSTKSSSAVIIIPEPTRKQRSREAKLDNVFLSLDFRSNLKEIDNGKYILSFPSQHNVYGVELESCIINSIASLEKEPYIYVAIDELEGDYASSTTKIFGKLVQEKTVNEFIVYKPENCIKFFTSPERIDQLSVSFLNYDHVVIALNKIHVRKLRKAHGYIKISSKTPHNLSINDRVNITCTSGNKVSVNTVQVLEVLREDMAALEEPVDPIDHGANLTFEKTDLKCTMTFKLSVN